MFSESAGRPASRMMLRGRLAKAGAGLAVAVAVLGAAGVATAASTVNHGVSRAAIRACYKPARRPASLLIPRGSRCPARYRSLTWNKTGPQGPQGLQGLQGPQGPQGPAGTFGSVTTVTSTSVIPNDTLGGVVASCPNGDVATGGGGSFGASNGSGVWNVSIQTSRPYPLTGTPTAWIVIGSNASGSSQTLDAYVVCAAS